MHSSGNFVVSSVGTFQTILCQIYVNEFCRRLFFENREKFIAGYKLAEDEKLLLSNLLEQEVINLAKGLAYKRLEVVKKKYQILFEQFPEAMEDFFFRAYSLVNADPNLHSEPYYLRLASTILQFIQYSNLPSICYDIFLYQYLKALVIEDKYGEFDLVSKTISLNYRPIVHPGVRFSFFSFEIQEVLSIHPQKLIDIKKSPCFYVFHRENKQISITKLSPYVAKILELCWGGNDFQKIFLILSNQFNKSQMENIRSKVFPLLLDKNILVVQE